MQELGFFDLCVNLVSRLFGLPAFLEAISKVWKSATDGLFSRKDFNFLDLSSKAIDESFEFLIVFCGVFTGCLGYLLI